MTRTKRPSSNLRLHLTLSQEEWSVLLGGLALTEDVSTGVDDAASNYARRLLEQLCREFPTLAKINRLRIRGAS